MEHQSKEFELPPIDKSEFLNIHKDINQKDYINSIKEAAIIIFYSAAAVGSSTALLLIPNLETMSIFIFLVSMMFGSRIGFSMMITTAIIFELFASMVYGSAFYIFPFKIISYIIIVISGSSLNPFIHKITNTTFKFRFGYGIFFSFIGVILTLLFDIITSFERYLILQNFEAYLLYFIAGIPLFIFHSITNSILFFFIPEYIKIIKITNKNFNLDSN